MELGLDVAGLGVGLEHPLRKHGSIGFLFWDRHWNKAVLSYWALPKPSDIDIFAESLKLVNCVPIGLVVSRSLS